MTYPIGLYPGGHPCICHSSEGLEAILQAAIQGDERPLCEVHDREAIRAREVDTERAQHQDHADRLEDVLTDITTRRNAEEQAKVAARLADQRKAAIGALGDPLLANLVRLTGADIALGQDPSAYPALAGFREMSPDQNRSFSDNQSNPNTSGDLPPAA